MRALSCLLLIGIYSPICRGEEKKPDIMGVADKVKAADNNNNGMLGSIFVEGAKDAKFTFDKASVRITDKTKIRKLNGRVEEDAKFEDIKNGKKVSVWFTGPVLESLPVQATAGMILIHTDSAEKTGKEK